MTSPRSSHGRRATVLIKIRAAETDGEFCLMNKGECYISVQRGKEALAGKSFIDTPEAWADALVWLRGVIEGEKNATDTALPWESAA